jgi:thymidylate kinase
VGSEPSQETADRSKRPLIAIVGVCASGKSTLAAELRQRGYNAREVLQEHSYVQDMWQRFTGPDLLIYLDATPETIRKRRCKPDWPSWLYENETVRLIHARNYCDLYVPTDMLTPSEILQQALALITSYAG